ncbi:hypothetical protein AOA60_16835 [Pseudomonas sp. 2822-17]|nr:hypothetical protein AOA60_16835 [Pseudomonas sp. 2822-17]
MNEVLCRHGVDIPRQTSARWVIHCDETRVQVMIELGREPTSQSWMWMQANGQPNQPVIMFDYSTNRAHEVP